MKAWFSVIAPRRGALIVAITIAAFCGVVYAGVGDVQAVGDNELWTLSDTASVSSSTPVSLLSDACRTWFGVEASGDYSNVVLHIIVSILLLLLCDQCLEGVGGPGPMVGALVFALLPVGVEAIAWSKGCFDLLASMFVILAVFAHMRDTRRAPIVSCVCFALALLSKDSALCLPIIALVSDLLFRGRPQRTWMGRYLGFAGVLVAYFVLRYAIGLSDTDGVQPIDVGGAIAQALPLSLKRVVLGMNLDPLHPLMAPTMGQWLIGLAVFAAGSAGAITLRKRFPSPQTKLIALGWAWFVLAHMPAAIASPKLEMIGDRHAYLPAVGMGLIVGAAMSALHAKINGHRHGRVLNLTLAGIVGLVWLSLGMRSAARVQDWRDAQVLYQASLRTNPDNALAHRSLAALDARDGRLEDALVHARRAVELDPGDWRAWNVMCVVQRKRKHFAKAEIACQRSLSSVDTHPSIWVNTAKVHMQRSNWAAAEREAREATNLAPASAEARYVHALSLSKLGRIDEAAAEARKALELDPEHRGAKDLIEQL
ncbi:MAG: hypothetical protein CSA75_00290 [Sorangium cellulosum]|nr:MAG: hypothetical protein CSA75_00290 [Sorangium cellulosum]